MGRFGNFFLESRYSIKALQSVESVSAANRSIYSSIPSTVDIESSYIHSNLGVLGPIGAQSANRQIGRTDENLIFRGRFAPKITDREKIKRVMSESKKDGELADKQAGRQGGLVGGWLGGCVLAWNSDHPRLPFSQGHHQETTIQPGALSVNYLFSGAPQGNYHSKRGTTRRLLFMLGHNNSSRGTQHRAYHSTRGTKWTTIFSGAPSGLPYNQGHHQKTTNCLENIQKLRV